MSRSSRLERAKQIANDACNEHQKDIESSAVKQLAECFLDLVAEHTDDEALIDNLKKTISNMKSEAINRSDLEKWISANQFWGGPGGHDWVVLGCNLLSEIRRLAKQPIKYLHD